MMTLDEHLEYYSQFVEDQTAQDLMREGAAKIRAYEHALAAYQQIQIELTDIARELAYEIEVWGDTYSDAYQMWVNYGQAR